MKWIIVLALFSLVLVACGDGPGINISEDTNSEYTGWSQVGEYTWRYEDDFAICYVVQAGLGAHLSASISCMARHE